VCFPQSRSGFLLGLALGGSVCGFFATIFRNNASYAAALAGYTAAIIASDLLGPTGGANGSVLILAIDRASEICIGIDCAGIVLAGTDFGGARYRLAAQFAAVAAEITKRICRHVLFSGAGAVGNAAGSARGRRPRHRTRSRHRRGDRRDRRPALSVARVAGGCRRPVCSDLRLARGRTNLELMPGEQGRHEANVILQTLPQDLRSEPTQATRQFGRPNRPGYDLPAARRCEPC
jgi:hypothetical protein